MKGERVGKAQELLRRGARRVLWQELDGLNNRLNALEAAVERDRSRADLGLAFAHKFESARQTEEFQRAFVEHDPLISVIIATYNRSSLLLERSLDSILNQTYRNLQVIVVGDHCDDDTMDLLAGINDPRLEYTNLPVRGPYPENARRRWMVAGSPAMNEGLRRANGAFVTHLDDDDRHPAHRVELLVGEAQKRKAELLWHPFRREMADGSWFVVDAPEFAVNQATTSSIFYHSWLARIHWDVDAHYSLEPGDWNRLRKMVWLDVKRERVNEVLLDHYREQNNK